MAREIAAQTDIELERRDLRAAQSVHADARKVRSEGVLRVAALARIDRSLRRSGCQAVALL
jgi:hypothetical protein